MRSRLLIALLVLFGVAGSAGCGSSTTSTGSGGGGTTTPVATERGTTPATTPAGGLAGTSWVLGTYQGAKGNAVPAVPGSSPTLAFGKNGALSGSTGCNQFSGTYVVDGQKLTMTLGPMTLAGCAGPLLDSQQTAITGALPKVTQFARADDVRTLSLAGAENRSLLMYSAGLASLEGPLWQATGVNNGTGGVQSSRLTQALTATFGPAGAFTGFGGCNQLTGTYATSGSDGLTISGLVSTKKACAPDVDALEGHYVTALGQVTTYAISGWVLTLRNSTGATQATYTLAS